MTKHVQIDVEKRFVNLLYNVVYNTFVQNSFDI